MPTKAPTFKPSSAASRSAIGKRPTSARQQGYDRTWEALRNAYIAQHPWCECSDCISAKRVQLADMVHHKQPIATHPHLRLEWDNLMSMADACHRRHHARHR